MVITSPALVFCLSALSIVRAWAPPAAIPFGRGTFSPGSSLSGRHLQVRPAAISHNNAMPPPLAHRQVASRLRCSAGELTDVAQLALPDAAQLSDTFAYFRDLTIAKVVNPTTLPLNPWLTISRRHGMSIAPAPWGFRQKSWRQFIVSCSGPSHTR